MRARVWTSIALLAGAGACVGQSAAPPRAIAVPWSKPGAVAAGSTGARWSYVPRRAAPLGSRVSLDAQHTLLFGGHGERWIHDAATATAIAAGELADEPLVALARPPSGAWLFVGAAGTVFEATEPTGPFVRIVAPPEPVARVDAAGAMLGAVTRRGTLIFSRDGGATFSQAAIDAFVSDVAIVDDLHALALSQPERLFATTDGGATWTPVDAPTVGASRLVKASDGSVAVVGWYTALSWRPDAPAALRDKLPTPPSFALDAELGPAPDATAVRDGRAFLRYGTYIVAVPPAKRGEAWSLGQAKLGERLTTAPLAGTEGCGRLALDGDDRWLVAACSTIVRGSPQAAVRILRWSSAAGEPEQLAWPLEGPLGEARIAVGVGGQVMAWGACRPGGAKACDPDVPLLLTRWETVSREPAPAAPSASTAPSASPSTSGIDSASPWLAASAPALGGRPVALRFGDGGSAYFVARRAKPRDVALFVSHDGGRSFEARELGVPDDPRLSASLSTSDAGIVSVGVEGGGPSVVVTDEDGRVVSLSRPPRGSATSHVAVDGRRALVVDGADVFESQDGGSSWEPLGPQASLRCDPKQKCDHPVICAPEGCLLGSAVARVGWGAPPLHRRLDSDASLASLPRAPSTPPPMVCRLVKEKWAPLPRGMLHIPNASDAERGKSAWATFAEDPQRGSFTMVQALGNGRIEEVPMLPPVRDPTTVAVGLSANQVEGAAAIRVTPGNDRGDVELAWANLFEGQISRATIHGASPPRPGVSFAPRPGPGVAHTANYHLLSITAGGVFLRPIVANGDPPLYFVDHRGRVEKSGFPGFPSVTLDGQPLGASPDAVRVDGKSVPVANVHPEGEAREGSLTADAVGLVRGRAKGAGFVFDALSLAPSTISPFHVNTQSSFAYLGDTPLFVVHTTTTDGAVSVDLFPLRADGPVVGARIAGPSQTDAVLRFRTCKDADRAKTPRVVVSAENGTRRAILIEGPDGTRFAALVSSAMVLYGTRASPCVAAMDAVPVREEDSAAAFEDADRVLVYPGDLEHGWFFRTGVDGGSVEARGMRCRIDPNAFVPPAIDRAIETGVVRPVARPAVRLRRLLRFAHEEEEEPPGRQGRQGKPQ